MNKQNNNILIGKKILEFYSKNKRDLPWRKNRDPYRIWISEIMCQQTRVDTVIPYFNRFMDHYPSISSLANANEDELLKLWEGLGYYNRARNLKKAAIKIQEDYDGVFPSTYEDLMTLPGIGDYTACAILSMAWDKREVSIDGNFYRVFSRFYELGNDINNPQTKEVFRKQILSILPSQSGDFNQAIMDIGATICLPNEEPRCKQCPLKEDCKACKNQSYLEYPKSSKIVIVKEYDISVFIIQVGTNYVLHRREETGLLASLYEFPNKNKILNINQVKKLYKSEDLIQEKAKTHHFTHQTWVLTPFIIKLDSYELKENEVFASIDELKTKYSIPKAFNQFFDLIIK